MPTHFQSDETGASVCYLTSSSVLKFLRLASDRRLLPSLLASIHPQKAHCTFSPLTNPNIGSQNKNFILELNLSRSRSWKKKGPSEPSRCATLWKLFSQSRFDFLKVELKTKNYFTFLLTLAPYYNDLSDIKLRTDPTR